MLCVFLLLLQVPGLSETFSSHLPHTSLSHYYLLVSPFWVVSGLTLGNLAYVLSVWESLYTHLEKEQCVGHFSDPSNQTVGIGALNFPFYLLVKLNSFWLEILFLESVSLLRGS